MAKNFAALATDALVYLRKCFAKKAPSVAGSSYDDVTGRIDDDPSPTPGPSPDPDPDPEPTEHTYDTYASEHVTTGVGEGGIDDDCVVVPIADIVSVYNEHGNASLSGAVENCVCLYLSDDKVSADVSQGLGDGTTTTWGEFDDQAECITLPLSFNSNMIDLISDEYYHGNWFIAIKPQSDSASLSSVSLVYTE